MDKAKKNRIKKAVTWIALASLVALLTAMPLLARSEAEADGPVASILSAEVTEGTITSAIRGGGNILAENVEEVKLPDGVKITGFLVKNGQQVTEGTPLATVDKVSVMTAITQVSETLDYLREELEDAREEKVPSAITATAGGRVKKIFAAQGESVRDVILRDGCLAIVSLDGRMAVKLEKDLPLTTGETVTVTLADGTDTEGRVESNLDGVLVITVEDEGYDIAQTVTVRLEGETLGEGSLYIHNAWKAIAYTGTVETVNAKEEQTLSSGATLLTLKDRDFDGELRRRSDQHREYEQLLQDLFQMYQTGILTAPCDGAVEGVDEDSPYLLSSVPESWVIAPLSAETPETGEKGYRVLLLSGTQDDPGQQILCTGNADCLLPYDQHKPEDQPLCKALCHDCRTNLFLEKHKASCITWCGKADSLEKCAALNHYSDCIHSCTYGTRETPCQGTKYHASGCIEFCKEADGVQKHCDATGDHKTGCIKACIQADTLGICTADPHHDANCIEKCNGKLDCASNKHTTSCPHYNLTYTAVAGVVVRTAAGMIEYTYESAVPVAAAKSGSGYTIAGSPNAKTMVNGPAYVSSNGVSVNAGDIILVVTGTDENNVKVVDSQVYVYAKGTSDDTETEIPSDSTGSYSGMGSYTMTGGFSGFGNYSGTTVEEESLFPLDGQILLTVTARDTAILNISVDEHDIARLTTGMSATVKLEALKDETFEATVTNIAVSGTNNGGSSKFSVELTLPMSEDMLSGMSASAIIPLEEKQNVLMIPAAALVQQGSGTFVCTALNDKGEPSAPVKVTTGLTDGENVEILSGLSKGQKIYYSYYDAVELDHSAEADKYTFG